MTFLPSPPSVPSLTTEQMIEVDRAMVEDYGIALVQMMENAGRNLAHLARERFLDGDADGKPVVVLAGTGGNGGGALVAARRLGNWGAKVKVVLTRPPDAFGGVPAHQLAIVLHTGMPVFTADRPADIGRSVLLLDGLIGYSLRGDPRGDAAALIRWANADEAPTLALDVPSGVNAGTGKVHEPAVRAAATLTLALPKKGLLVSAARPFVGELYLADIGVPPELYAKAPLSLDVGSIFSASEIVRLY